METSNKTPRLRKFSEIYKSKEFSERRSLPGALPIETRSLDDISFSIEQEGTDNLKVDSSAPNKLTEPLNVDHDPSTSSDAQEMVQNDETPKRIIKKAVHITKCTPKAFTSGETPTLQRSSAPLEMKSRKETFTPDPFYSQRKRKSYPPDSRSSPTSSGKRPATDQTPFQVEEPFMKRKRLTPKLPYYNAFELLSFKSDSGFIDSHCHLDFLFQRQGYRGTYSQYQKEHKSTYPESYRGCIAVFCNPFTFPKKYVWEKFLEEEGVWAAFGCHPHNAKDYNDYLENMMCDALKHSKVRALGEIGLDYSNRNSCLKEVQHEVFRKQLKIALRLQLPLVIHCREAHEDGMKIMKEMLPHDYVIHLHCFTSTWQQAEEWLDQFPNLFIGITNVVTFPSAESVHEVARNIPLDRLLLETDSPYFIPRMVSKGTRFSHPGMAVHVAAQIAALKCVPLEQVLLCTRNNTKRVYKV